MSTVSPHQRQRRSWQPDEAAGHRPRGKRRRWRLLIVVLLLAALVWLLPTLVAHTPLLRWGLAKATADLSGTLAIDSASLGWLSPITLRGIEVCDVQHQPVLQAVELTSSKSLAGILWNLSSLGTLRIEQPKLTVLLRKDGSNLEDVLAKYLAPKKEPVRRADVVLEVVDGSATVTDQQRGQSWQIEKLSLTLGMSADAHGPLELKTSSAIVDPQHPGRLDVDLKIQQHTPGSQPPAVATEKPKDFALADMAPGSSGELSLKSAGVPLAMFQSLLNRFVPQTHLAGRLSAEIRCRWDGEGPARKTSLQAELTIDGLILSGPPLGTDQVQLQNLHAACEITQEADRIRAERSAIESDLGSLSLSGTVQLGKQLSGSWADAALHQPCQLHGRLDLARLAAMLPTTLRIRQQTQITSGQVQLAFSSRQEAQGMIWYGRLEANNLAAVDRGRQVTWERPILMVLSAHDSPQGPVVESLQCDSDFLKLHASGTADELAASASFNLKQLADQLNQFVELGGMELAGDGWARFNWKRSPQQQFTAESELQIRDFQLKTPQQKPWTEPNLVASLTAKGRTDLGVNTRLDEASCRVQTATDRLEVQLTEPVADLRRDSWPLSVQLGGQLEPWIARLATWIVMDQWNLEGSYQLAVPRVAISLPAGDIGRLKAEFTDAEFTASQLRLNSPWINLDEPSVELAASGSWDQLQRRLQLEPAALISNSVSLRAKDLVLAMPEKGPLELSGLIEYRGTLERVQPWFTERGKAPAWRIAGELGGTSQLRESAGMIHADLAADINNLMVVNAAGERFQEAKVQLAARGDYEPQAGLLRLEQLELNSGTLGGSAAGRLSRGQNSPGGGVQPQAAYDMDLAGQVNYDLEKIAVLLRPYLGPGIRVAGRGSSPAACRGLLTPGEMQANAAVKWDWINLYGVPVGPGELKATLSGGIVNAEPLDLELSQGRLLLTPRVRLAPEPQELTLAPGPLARQVQITPQMCAYGLKYIAPILADVATAQGAFSIDLEGCRIPLNDPAKSELAGRMVIHSIEIGPGSLIRELAMLLGRETPAKLRQESVVPFRVVDGRIYHQGLELIFPELTIRTHGSVGLDQTLALMAEMPIPPKWLVNDALASALRDQTLRLPIGGTLSRPQLDRSVLDQLNRQLLGNAAKNVIEDEIGKQLDRLLHPAK